MKRPRRVTRAFHRRPTSTCPCHPAFYPMGHWCCRARLHTRCVLRRFHALLARAAAAAARRSCRGLRFRRGAVRAAWIALDAGPELSDDGGMFVEFSAAIAGTAAKRAANAVAAVIFFMAFPSSNFSLTENQRRGCLRVPHVQCTGEETHWKAIASEEKTEASRNSWFNVGCPTFCYSNRCYGTASNCEARAWNALMIVPGCSGAVCRYPVRSSRLRGLCWRLAS